MRETPNISSTAYASQTVGLQALNQNMTTTSGTTTLEHLYQQDYAGQVRHAAVRAHAQVIDNFPNKSQETYMATPTRRLVQVIIVDPNENVPLKDCLIYKGEPQLTDATDQELFYEIEIKELLSKHNDKRTKCVDKKVKERTEYLEPAKIRDLKMVVVTIASF